MSEQIAAKSQLLPCLGCLSLVYCLWVLILILFFNWRVALVGSGVMTAIMALVWIICVGNSPEQSTSEEEYVPSERR